MEPVHVLGDDGLDQAGRLQPGERAMPRARPSLGERPAKRREELRQVVGTRGGQAGQSPPGPEFGGIETIPQTAGVAERGDARLFRHPCTREDDDATTGQQADSLAKRVGHSRR
jgi:hypothetical protein